VHLSLVNKKQLEKEEKEEGQKSCRHHKKIIQEQKKTSFQHKTTRVMCCRNRTSDKSFFSNKN
jgi:hypothetical protein